jgi:secreted trypsin-like serine protease
MALRYAFLLVAVALAINLASGFRLKNPVHIYPKEDPIAESLSHRVLKNTRVVSGENARLGQFPYQIHLFYQVSVVSGFLCGGSIIAADWILTAGHCVDGYVNEPANFHLTAGSISSSGTGGQELQGRKVIQHEGYNAVTEHDIAVIQTQGSYSFNSNVAAICVPPASYRASGSGVISGWGKTSGTGSTATTLQYATVTIISDASCQNIFSTTAVRDNDICAGPGPQGQTSCNGDSGGPLAVADRVVGIVSRGYTACNDATIYTETAYYTDWIATNAGVGSC